MTRFPIKPTHYVLELHPEVPDGSPNAWRALGFERKGDSKPCVVMCGDTADQALHNTMIVTL